MADTVFARAKAVLCRFEPEFVAEIHRSLARGAPSIVGASPLVLASSLAHDTAVFGTVEADILSRWLVPSTEIRTCPARKPKSQGYS